MKSLASFTKTAQSILEILWFFDFQDGSNAILDFGNHQILLAEGVWGQMRITVPNFV